MIVARTLYGPGFTIIDYFPSFYDRRIKLIAQRLDRARVEPRSYDQSYIQWLAELADELEEYYYG